MKLEGEAQLLRIFVAESDRFEGRPLYEAIVRAARDHGLKGATALRGIEGFGASNRIHTVKILRLSEDLPIVIEIVDRPERIATFLPTLDKMVGEGLVTMERVSTLIYRRDHAREAVEEDELQLQANEPPQSTAPPGQPVQPTNETRKIIELAKRSAADSHRFYVDSVDVLLSMLRDTMGVAGRVLANQHVAVGMVESCLQEVVNRDEQSATFLTALEEKSAAEAKWLGHDYAGTEHLLLALCQIRPNAATDILMRLGVHPRDICREVLQILGRRDDWQRWLSDHPDM